jgi:hypothetical protein
LSSWWQRPSYLVAAALVGGAIAIVAVVIVLVFARGGDGGDADKQVVATATPLGAPAATPTGAATPEPTTEAQATPTLADVQDPDDALAAFVRDRLDSEHIGDCPLEQAPGQEPPQGVCSQEIYRTDEMVTFMLGHPFSEGIGEIVITRNEDGTWSTQFIEAPPLGESLEVGRVAVVFGAGDCLNFRAEPSLSAEEFWCLLDGTKGQVLEGPVEADDHTWWRLEDLGWASGDFLAPVAN